MPATHDAWKFSAVTLRLDGVHHAEAWLKWATEAGYHISSPEDMATLVLQFKGNPSQVIAAIKIQFPYRNGRIQQSSYQRKLLYEAMIKAFDLADLKKICFFLGINHEELPDHGHLGGLVRELIARVENHGRLPELIQLCRDERPHLNWVSA